MKKKIFNSNQASNLFSMRNKVAVIFGGTGKLGEQFSNTLSQYGAKVYVLDIKVKTKKNYESSYLKCDVQKESSINAAFKKIYSKEKKIDVIIYNVYSKPNNYYKSFENYDLKVWKKVVDSNLTGAFLVSQAAIKKFLKDKIPGNIIFLSSTYGVSGPDPSIYEGLKSKKNIYGGKFPLNTPAAYSSTKTGLIGLSKYIATNFGKYKIRSNVLSPGGVFDNQEKTFVTKYTNKVPLKRMAKWSDYNGAILFLASDASKYMTGANLIVDGGWTAW
jgi:NAD(P)-dependent dehydrogenase (short-subunit alcohol dehydrogenase family)